MGRPVIRLLLQSQKETTGTWKGGVMGIDRNDRERTSGTWSFVGSLPKLKGLGRWERADLGEVSVLFWACTTL